MLGQLSQASNTAVKIVSITFLSANECFSVWGGSRHKLESVLHYWRFPSLLVRKKHTVNWTHVDLFVNMPGQGRAFASSKRVIVFLKSRLECMIYFFNILLWHSWFSFRFVLWNCSRSRVFEEAVSLREIPSTEEPWGSVIKEMNTEIDVFSNCVLSLCVGSVKDCWSHLYGNSE